MSPDCFIQYFGYIIQWSSVIVVWYHGKMGLRKTTMNIIEFLGIIKKKGDPPPCNIFLVKNIDKLLTSSSTKVGNMALESIKSIISRGILLIVCSLKESKECILNHLKETGNYILQAHLSMVYFCHYSINKRLYGCW